MPIKTENRETKKPKQNGKHINEWGDTDALVPQQAMGALNYLTDMLVPKAVQNDRQKTNNYMYEGEGWCWI